MVRQAARRHGHAIVAALLFSLVVAIAVEQRGVDELALLQLDNIVDIDQFVVPGIERDDLARVVGKEIRDGTGLHRCHDLLPLWREGRDAELDLVAARLFVIGDDFFDRGIFLRNETLRPPHFGRCRRSVGDIRLGQCSDSHEAQRITNERTARQPRHGRLLPCSRPTVGGRSYVLVLG